RCSPRPTILGYGPWSPAAGSTPSATTRVVTCPGGCSSATCRGWRRTRRSTSTTCSHCRPTGRCSSTPRCTTRTSSPPVWTGWWQRSPTSTTGAVACWRCTTPTAATTSRPTCRTPRSGSRVRPCELATADPPGGSPSSTGGSPDSTGGIGSVGHPDRQRPGVDLDHELADLPERITVQLELLRFAQLHPDAATTQVAQRPDVPGPPVPVTDQLATHLGPSQDRVLDQHLAPDRQPAQQPVRPQRHHVQLSVVDLGVRQQHHIGGQVTTVADQQGVDAGGARRPVVDAVPGPDASAALQRQRQRLQVRQPAGPLLQALVLVDDHLCVQPDPGHHREHVLLGAVVAVPGTDHGGDAGIDVAPLPGE